MTVKRMTPFEEARSIAYDEMHPVTREIAAQVEVHSRTIDTGVALKSWDIGDLIQRAQSNDVCGLNAVDQIAAFTNLSLSWLLELQAFATRFTRDQVKEAMALRMANGERLSLSHFLALGRCRSLSDQSRLMERTLSESLSARQVLSEVEATLGAGRSNAGRKPERPTSIAAGVNQIIKQASGWLKRHEMWEEAVFAGVDEAAPASIDDQLLENLQQAHQLAEQVAELATTTAARLSTNIERAKKVLNTRSSSVAKATAGVSTNRRPRPVTLLPEKSD